MDFGTLMQSPKGELTQSDDFHFGCKTLDRKSLNLELCFLNFES